MTIIKTLLYKLGRALMHLNYTRDAYTTNAHIAEHDLRLEISELKRKVSRLSIENTKLKTRLKK